MPSKTKKISAIHNYYKIFIMLLIQLLKCDAYDGRLVYASCTEWLVEHSDLCSPIPGRPPPSKRTPSVYRKKLHVSYEKT